MCSLRRVLLVAVLLIGASVADGQDVLGQKGLSTASAADIAERLSRRSAAAGGQAGSAADQSQAAAAAPQGAVPDNPAAAVPAAGPVSTAVPQATAADAANPVPANPAAATQPVTGPPADPAAAGVPAAERAGVSGAAAAAAAAAAAPAGVPADPAAGVPGAAATRAAVAPAGVPDAAAAAVPGIAPAVVPGAAAVAIAPPGVPADPAAGVPGAAPTRAAVAPAGVLDAAGAVAPAAVPGAAPAGVPDAAAAAAAAVRPGAVPSGAAAAVPGAAPAVVPGAAAAAAAPVVPDAAGAGVPGALPAAGAAEGGAVSPFPSPRPRRRRRRGRASPSPSPTPEDALTAAAGLQPATAAAAALQPATAAAQGAQPAPVAGAPAAASAQSTSPPTAAPAAAASTAAASGVAAAAAAPVPPGNITAAEKGPAAVSGSDPQTQAGGLNATEGANTTQALPAEGTAGAANTTEGNPDGTAQSAGDELASRNVEISPAPGFSNTSTPRGNSPSAGSIAGAILGVLAGIFVLVALSGLICYCRRRRIKREKKLKQANKPFVDAKPQGPGKPSWLSKFTGKFEKKSPTPGPAHAPKVLPGPGPGPYANGARVYSRSPSGGPGGPMGGPGGAMSGPGPLSAATNGSFTSRSPSPTAYGSVRSAPLGAAAAAAVGAGASGAGALSAVAVRPGMAYGFTGDELQDGLRDLKHVVTNKLLPAVDNSTMAVDPVAAWIDAGMAEVRPQLSNPSCGASHTFVEDWRTHRVYDYLSGNYWKFIPTDERLLELQVQTNEPQMDFARRMLSEINRNPRFPPFATAINDAVESLLEDAINIAKTMGVLSSSSAMDSSVRRLRDQGMSPAAQSAAIYYRPVLTQLFETALKLHLQVQGTAETAYIFCPGAPPAVSLAIPERGLVRKDRLGSAAAELHYLCESPGVFSEDARATGGVDVWVPAQAIRVGLRPSGMH